MIGTVHVSTPTLSQDVEVFLACMFEPLWTSIREFVSLKNLLLGVRAVFLGPLSSVSSFIFVREIFIPLGRFVESVRAPGKARLIPNDLSYTVAEFVVACYTAKDFDI
jgi:hypothetical protein